VPLFAQKSNLAQADDSLEHGAPSERLTTLSPRSLDLGACLGDIQAKNPSVRLGNSNVDAYHGFKRNKLQDGANGYSLSGMLSSEDNALLFQLHRIRVVETRIS